MKFYLCGPISLGGTLSEEYIKINLERFKEIENKIHSADKKYVVFNPANLPKLKSWKDYMKLTIPMVCEADTIVLLPGWEKSKGAVIEFQLAHQLEKDFIFEI